MANVQHKDLTGTDLHVMSSDGSVNPTNLLINGDFQNWSSSTAAAPDGWTIGGTGAAVAREATTIKLGTYSAKVTYGSAVSYIYQSIESTKTITYWRQTKVTFGCWVYCATASVARLQIADDATSAYSSYHTGDSTWQWLSVTLSLSLSSNYVRLFCEAEATGSAYFDGAMCVEGSSTFAFSAKPITGGTGGLALVDNDTTGTGLYISQDGVLAASCYGLYVYSNVAQTTSALVNFTQNSSSSTADNTYVVNAGTGNGLYIEQSGVLATSKYALYVHSNAIQINAPLVLFHQDSTSSSQSVLYILNEGGGHAGIITQSSALATACHGLYVIAQAANTLGDSAVMKVVQDHASSSEPALEIDNDGFGAGLEIDCDGSHTTTPVVGMLVDVDNAIGGNQIAIDVDQVDEAKSYFARFNATSAWTSAKDPETHAEAGWIKIMVGTTAYFIPYYAAS